MLLSVVCFHKHVRAHLLWNEKKMLQVIYLGCPGLKSLHVAPSYSSSKMHFNGVLKAQRPLPAPFPKSTAVLCSSPVARGFTESMSWVSFTKKPCSSRLALSLSDTPPHCPPRGIKTSTTTSSSSSSAPPIRTHTHPSPPTMTQFGGG